MGFFRIKPIARLILKCGISGSHTISDQSLLLSTIVLNDIHAHNYEKLMLKLKVDCFIRVYLLVSLDFIRSIKVCI